MNDDIWDEYETAVNAQWLKMGEANTPEEIQEVLDTWPKREDYYKEENEEDEDE